MLLGGNVPHCRLLMACRASHCHTLCCAQCRYTVAVVDSAAIAAFIASCVFVSPPTDFPHSTVRGLHVRDCAGSSS